MPVLFEYIGGYGWHIGRLLLWPLLLLVGVGSSFVLEVVGQFACAIYNWPGFYALFPPLIVPALCSAMFAKRIRKKLRGEPFVVNLGSLFYDGETAWLVPRGHRHFRALLALECVIWGSSILAQLFLVLSPLMSARMH